MSSAGVLELDPSQGEWAVGFARDVVEAVVDDGTPPGVPRTVDPVFETERGAFVTLEAGDSLRGCIGRPYPEQTAITAIQEAATGAATNDPRFPPVAPTELDAITVEVSVLTPPEPLGAGDPATYPDELTIGRDGLIVEYNGRSGLLLPQVPVDQGWDSTTFLRETCRKAGLPGDCWRDEGAAITRFGAQVFAEVEPAGPVAPVGLDSDGGR